MRKPDFKNLNAEHRDELRERLSRIRLNTVFLSFIPLACLGILLLVFGFPFPNVPFIIHQVVTWTSLAYTFYRVIYYRPGNWDGM